MKRIACDVDGVLAQFNGAFRRVLENQGAVLTPFEDGHNPTMWDWPVAYGATDEQYRSAWAWVESHPWWWGNLPAHQDFTPEAQRALDNLTRNNEVTFVSSRPNGRDALGSWLRMQLAAWDTPQVLLTPGDDKHWALVAMKPHVVIEDKIETLRTYDWIQRDTFDTVQQAELILIRRPYTVGDTTGLTVVNSTLEAFQRAVEICALQEVA